MDFVDREFVDSLVVLSVLVKQKFEHISTDYLPLQCCIASLEFYRLA